MILRWWNILRWPLYLNHLSTFELLCVTELSSFADEFAALHNDSALFVEIIHSRIVLKCEHDQSRLIPEGPTNLELLAVHGGYIGLLANGKGVGHGLSGRFGGNNKVIAILLDLSNWLNVFGHLDDVFWQFWYKETCLHLLGLDKKNSTAWFCSFSPMALRNSS